MSFFIGALPTCSGSRSRRYQTQFVTVPRVGNGFSGFCYGQIVLMVLPLLVLLPLALLLQGVLDVVVLRQSLFDRMTEPTFEGEEKEEGGRGREGSATAGGLARRNGRHRHRDEGDDYDPVDSVRRLDGGIDHDHGYDCVEGADSSNRADTRESLTRPSLDRGVPVIGGGDVELADGGLLDRRLDHDMDRYYLDQARDFSGVSSHDQIGSHRRLPESDRRLETGAPGSKRDPHQQDQPTDRQGSDRIGDPADDDDDDYDDDEVEALVAVSDRRHLSDRDSSVLQQSGPGLDSTLHVSGGLERYDDTFVQGMQHPPFALPRMMVHDGQLQVN